jgi:hypothetical protein
MKVMCVKPFNAPESKGKPKPEVGDEDVVENTSTVFGITYYALVRFGELMYKADHFATLPDQPADELNEKEQEEKYYIRTIQPA